ncbi:MAG: hypothetical protein ACRDFS_10730 [Chloroflexota bacterium]
MLNLWLNNPVLLHAFGKRYELPIPLALFVFGGAAVVLASFLLVLPRTVVAEEVDIYPDKPGPYHFRLPVAILSWLITVLLIVSGLIGSQLVAENILPTSFWLVAWIAVPVSCGIFGNWTKGINPYSLLALAVDRPTLRKAVLGGPVFPYPSWLGFWPAVLIFFIVACSELIYNATSTIPAVTSVGLLIYGLVTAVGALLFGSEIWLERGEMFSVLFGTWGKLGFFRFGAPGARGFLGGLKARFEPTVSRITFVLLLLSSVSFDGILSTPAWKHARDQLPVAFAAGTLPYLLLATLAFIVLVLIAWALFGLFSLAVRESGSLEGSVTKVLSGLLISLLPIAFGYLVAHNGEYLLINGQLLLPLLGNPPGVSWWPTLAYPFNDSYEINKNLLPSAGFWYFDVALIIAVHVAAVVLAHDFLLRATRTVRRARQAEWPWVVAMVLYTMSSLWLLAQPLVKGG